MRSLLRRFELRFAARRLRRSPGFTTSVVIMLALGVGATTAMFSLVNGILLAPLPFHEPERLVRLTHAASDAGRSTLDLSDAMVLLYQDDSRAFEGVAAWRFDDGDLSPSDPGQTAVRVRGARVTANFFEVLGVLPEMGTGFAPGADRPGASRVVVLSHRLWQERLHGDRNAIGRQIEVNGVPRTIVGIMPPRFAYPASEVEVWLPLALDPGHTRPATLSLVGVGRLKRGVSIAAAQADLARALTHLGEYAHAGGSAAAWEQAHFAPRAQSLRDSIVGPPARVLWFVFASVMLVLVVACINVAGLLLARAERAQTELAVRAALGSGLIGMLALTLGESVLLSVMGGGGGVLLALAGMRAVRGAGAALRLPRLENVALDGRVLLFALAVTAFCALFVSIVPLLRARRVSIAQVLRRAGPGAEGGRPERMRSALVVAQIALAVVLVTLSGLMTRSLLRLYQVRPGFQADGVVSSRVLLPYSRYGGSEARLGFFQAMAREARSIPGVRRVALTDWVPLSPDRHDLVVDLEGGASGVEHGAARVDDQYFGTMGIPLLAGRAFAPADATRPTTEAIVSRSFAARYWPGESPLGKRVRPTGGEWYTVVGVVGDVSYDGLEQPPSETVYLPIVAAPGALGSSGLPGAFSLVVRTDAGEAGTIAAIRRIVANLDRDIPTFDEGPLQRLVDDASARPRTISLLLAIASAVTLLLGAVGLYGIMAYSVSVRRRELGIRLALGARPADLSRMVSLLGLKLAGAGIVIGIVCALAASRLLHGLLYGVSPTDLVTLAATPAALLAIAFIASWIPAHRAARVDPAEALQGG